MIDHSFSRQKTRIVFFTFERGQKRGLVFTPSKKNVAKEILALDMKYHVVLKKTKKKKNKKQTQKQNKTKIFKREKLVILKREELVKKISAIKILRYVTK